MHRGVAPVLAAGANTVGRAVVSFSKRKRRPR